jgi:3-hydroxyacyl-CoA dehydrogenase
VAKAIALICEGRIVKAAEARALGLLDQIAEGDVLEAAIEAAPGAVKRIVSALPIADGDAVAEDEAAKAALKAAKGVPAIAEAIRVIRASRDGSFTQGLARERAAFLALRESEAARALRHLFLAEREAAKIPGLDDINQRAYARCGVIGAGTMGAGIAVSMADAGLYVTVVERDDDSAAAGLARIRAAYERQVQNGRLTEAAMAERLARFTLTTDWAPLAHVDLVIEAAFEDMAVKQDIFRRLDAVAAPGAILATNTSYLDIEALADVTARPQDVIGLHFFAPANVMKLLEIARPARIAPEVLATGVALARKLGKQPVVAGVCDGFIGNRIYAVYRRHAEYLIAEGASPEQIDSALEAYGFAMGVFAVSDMSGLDIAWSMRKRRAATRPAGERYIPIADALCELGRFGRKTGSGWYAYDASGKKSVDPTTTALIENYRRDHQIRPRAFTTEEIQRRILAAMVNEGAKVLSEGIAYRASDIDLAFVNGYGFPRLKGGPMWAADRLGLDSILAEVESAYAVGGVGSEPAPLLIELAREGKTFTAWRKS